MNIFAKRFTKYALLLSNVVICEDPFWENGHGTDAAFAVAMPLPKKCGILGV